MINPVELGYKEERIEISELGIYNIGDLKVWVVKNEYK